ncbi:hypothetical protein [Helicobacter cinaedi]|uniref:hypothetical protein n=1 Tax=Helicobacter cinaedi TaxID=213 RepID=UPI000E2074B5|nr:hypothetical protein [Helicobacter cinaedi]
MRLYLWLKSRILYSPTAALTFSKLLVGSFGADEVKPVSRKNHDFSSKILPQGCVAFAFGYAICAIMGILG